ncbi:MAG TPA: hypothetical protein VFQ68_36525 [Streptosporangiaceae bacterium]|nr:hypothetical protein [Streptosporangiaceae bacterium]
MKDVLDRVLPRIGGNGVIDQLAALSGSDFTSVMLEVARRRAARQTPASVLRRYEQDRFVRPGQVPAMALRRVEDVLLGGLPGDVEVVSLAPLVPLGTHSALGPVSQDKVVSTIRGSEVAADPTNALALETAARRARARGAPPAGRAPSAHVRLAAVQRVVRAQQVPDAPGFFAHFGLFALVTAGRDTGSLEFERSALTGQLGIAIHGVSEALVAGGAEAAGEARATSGGGTAAGGGTADVRVALTPLSDQGERIAAAVTAELAVTAGLRAGGTAEIVIDRGRQAGRGYYRHLCFKVMAHAGGEPTEIGDGGFTDWTARLTANAKERLLICGLSTDRLATLSAGTA